MATLANITRRMALSTLSALPAVAALPAAAVPVDPLERFQAALSELKAAAEALDPNIYDWTIRTNGNLNCGLLVTAWRKTTKYEGDGWYEATVGSEQRVFVERTPQFDSDRERWFRIAPEDGKRRSYVMAESSFTVEFGRKL